MTNIHRREALRYLGSITLAPVVSGGLSRICLADDAANTVETPVASLPEFTPGATTFAVLPDTQVYSRAFPKMFDAQTEWLVAQKEHRNIACVLQLGDITDNNVEPQWKNAQSSLTKLDGHIPYFLALGNHDYGPNGNATTRDTFFNQYFPLEKYKQEKTFGGVYDKEPDSFNNSFHKFSAAGRDWLVVSLEFGPREDVVRWANEVAGDHPDRSAILITHAYVYSDDTRYDWAEKEKKQHWNPHSYGVAKLEGGVNDGEELWQKLVKKHPNFVMTLNGHVLNSGVGRTTTKNEAGRDVHQMMVNFQTRPNGGDTWMRLLEIQPDGETIRVYDYAPALDELNENPRHRFDLEMAAAVK